METPHYYQSLPEVSKEEDEVWMKLVSSVTFRTLYPHKPLTSYNLVPLCYQGSHGSLYINHKMTNVQNISNHNQNLVMVRENGEWIRKRHSEINEKQ